MIAAHHYQLTRHALLQLYKEQPTDPFVAHSVKKLGWDIGISDSRLTEVDLAPFWYRDRIKAKAVSITLFGEPSGTTPELQQSFDTMCNEVSNPAEGNLCQDMQDFLDNDHWEDTPRAQCVHFMRATGQSTAEAYTMAISWIESNIAAAATQMTANLNFATANNLKNYAIMAGLPSKHLGRALHAFQDSFSQGHALRSEGEAGRTGPILTIYSYKNQDHDKHAEADVATVNTGWVYDDFSEIGKVIIRATKELIWLTIQLAHEAASSIHANQRWEVFRRKWLVLSPQWRQYSAG